MVVKYGMDQELGPMIYSDKDKDEYKMYKSYSEKTAEIIDAKIKKYLFDCYEKSKKLIKDNKNLIEKMSKVLLEKEYLTKEEFVAMMEDISKVDEFIKQIAKDKLSESKQIEKLKEEKGKIKRAAETAKQINS